MRILALTTALLIGISSAAIAAEGIVTPSQREAIKTGVDNAVAVDPTIAPLGTNNAGAPITSTNPAVGNTPTATNTPGDNNIPGGMKPNGTAADTPSNPRSLTNGYNPDGTITNSK